MRKLLDFGNRYSKECSGPRFAERTSEMIWKTGKI